MTHRIAAAALCTAFTLVGCQNLPFADAESGDAPEPETKATPEAEIGDWGVDLNARQPAADAGDDFNRYVNGRWLDNYDIPADLSSYGIFIQLRLDAEADVRALIEEIAARDSSPGTLSQKVGDFYADWMNVEALNAKGAAPLAPHLARIRAIDSREALMREMASLDSTKPFGLGIIPDPADPTRYSAIVAQSGLGMPNRDYYLDESDRFAEYRKAYRDYIVEVLTLAGIANAEAKAERIIALETKIAEVHWTPQRSRKIDQIYNPMDATKLAEVAPQFDWSMIFSENGIADVGTYVVLQPSAISAAGELIDSTPLEQWKTYLSYHFIRSHAQYLSQDFDDANYRFFSETLRGTEEQRARWKRGVQQVNDNMGEAVGKLYVQRHFPPSHKAQMEQLVDNLQAAFRERLKDNAWMDDATRSAALKKLDTFEPRIGYTEKWTDYTSLVIEDGELLDNALRLTRFNWQQQVDRLGGPVDRKVWPYPPQTVNASYNPLLNQITFPAGILQPPFFDPNADPAVNYGAIGAVIGHEIGHGFDDQGRKFDHSGRINDWWTDASNKAFSKRTKRLGEQYDQYEPVEGLNVSGELTMGENIGDLGGVEIAYAAYQRHLANCCNGKAEVIDGFSGDQRFFLSFGQVWRAKAREDALRKQVKTDPHSPPQYRINGVVRNVDVWYDAYGVEPEDALYLPPEERVRIW